MLVDFFLTVAVVHANAAVTWTNGNWAFKCHFPRSPNLKTVNIDCSQCGQQCWDHAGLGCTHWTCNNGRCELKKGPFSETAGTVESREQWRTCGFNELQEVGTPASGGVVQGITTRYWDCCKPACSWHGKAAGTTPVRSCAKDGVTSVDAAVESSCENGEAHTCSDQVPFVINETLAYGFVAANVAGKPESDICCACYRIDFTSGPVVGKSMIVQLIDIGWDLHTNHFDIHIPGGGVGIFTKGCARQWGAPGNGWGARYGGVSTLAECGHLPAQLQEGCKFRFGWFRGAENPNVNFKRVKCPQALVRRTLCQRPDDSNV